MSTPIVVAVLAVGVLIGLLLVDTEQDKAQQEHAAFALGRQTCQPVAEGIVNKQDSQGGIESLQQRIKLQYDQNERDRRLIGDGTACRNNSVHNNLMALFNIRAFASMLMFLEEMVDEMTNIGISFPEEEKRKLLKLRGTFLALADLVPPHPKCSLRNSRRRLRTAMKSRMVKACIVRFFPNSVCLDGLAKQASVGLKVLVTVKDNRSFWDGIQTYLRNRGLEAITGGLVKDISKVATIAAAAP
ncbi:MAG: hypothetical protein SGARI_001540 [Bacillariaceae sp.]